MFLWRVRRNWVVGDDCLELSNWHSELLLALFLEDAAKSDDCEWDAKGKRRQVVFGCSPEETNFVVGFREVHDEAEDGPHQDLRREGDEECGEVPLDCLEEDGRDVLPGAGETSRPVLGHAVPEPLPEELLRREDTGDLVRESKHGCLCSESDSRDRPPHVHEQNQHALVLAA